MGSPVSAVIANLYMEVFEEQTIEFVSNNPKHSVYDTFTILDRSNVDSFLKHLFKTVNSPPFYHGNREGQQDRPP